MKLGSLFDGSGGFPLAGTLCGIEPVWAAEVEPYPIAVTSSRFPKMRHLGSVTDIHGGKVEPVDIFTFGSPCQDLSVAGKRAGLKHEANGDEETTRSGLFMEAVRIIKEMREATNGRYPTFAVWENVPGAFSSNKGEDFRIVLEELIKIVEPTAVMPAVPKGGWAYADYYRGDGWSLSYRVLDAQYWGVPQRRRRIYLVADFGGERARKILFEREGLRGYLAESGETRQAASAHAEGSAGADGREGAVGLDIYNLATTGGIAASLTTATGQGASNTGPSVCVPYTLKIRSGCEGGGKGALVQTDKSATLATNNDQYLFQPVSYGISSFDSNAMKSKNPHSGIYEAKTSRTLDINGGNPACNQGGLAIVSIEGNGARPSHQGIGCSEDGKMYTLNTIERHAVAYEEAIVLDRAFFNQGQNAQYEPQFYTDGTASTIVARGPSAVAYVDTTHADDVVRLDDTVAPLQARDYKGGKLVQIRYIVRRLTPTECARLQGFADRWGDIEEKTDFTDEEYRFWLDVRNTHAAINGKATKSYTREQMVKWYNGLHTDSAEYKMWGNGIALPCARYVMEGIAEVSNEVL